MSITRAFTTRKVKMSIDLAQEARERNALQRSNTAKAAFGHSSSISRPKISAPVELLYTTNMLSYNAPDIAPRPPSSQSSSKSSDQLDSPTLTDDSSPPTSPDIPNDQHPMAEPNHLSCYFTPPGQPLKTAQVVAPVIPSRSPSHTKKASLEISRQRSVSALSRESGRSSGSRGGFSFSRSSSASTSTSVASHSSISAPYMSKPPMVTVPYERSTESHAESHPFGQELEQVREMAEEFGVEERLHIVSEEEQDILARGLRKFSADAYLLEVQMLSSLFFNDAPAVMTGEWI